MMPDLLKRLAEDITWTTNLGNAFLAQQQDVMDAVQRLRTKAKNDGKLESNDKMVVETKVVEKETVVVIQPPSPQVVYVPTYNPTVIWGRRRSTTPTRRSTTRRRPRPERCSSPSAWE